MRSAISHDYFKSALILIRAATCKKFTVDQTGDKSSLITSEGADRSDGC
jgi:hypothetical protein